MITEELAIKIPTVFPELFEDAWKHKDTRGPGNRIGLYCTKCKIEYTRQNDELGKPCTVPDPIVIDWNVAMKVVKEVIGDVGIRKWINVCEKHTKISRTPLDKATPADYLRAALETKKIK